MKYNGINISSQGLTGTQGVQGVQGTQGILGLPGIQGIQGATGNTGAAKFRGIHNALPTVSGDIISFPVISTSNAQASGVANRLYAVPFIPVKDTAYSALSINVIGSTTSGLARILIYSDLNGIPNTKLYESTDLSLTSVGRKIVLTSGTFLAGVTYWLCYYNNTTTSTIQQVPQSFNYSCINVSYDVFFASYIGYYIDVTYGSAPTTFGGGNAFNGTTPNFAAMIYITIA